MTLERRATIGHRKHHLHEYLSLLSEVLDRR